MTTKIHDGNDQQTDYDSNEKKLPKGSRMPSARLALVSILVSLSASFHFGMQLTATNPSHNSFLQFVNDSVRTHYGLHLNNGRLEALWSIIVAVLFVGSIFGSFFIRSLSDRIGRLKSLLIGNLFSSLCLAGCTASYFKNSFELFTLSRFGLGFSLALCLGTAGIFLAECRVGFVVALAMAFSGIAVVNAFAVELFLSTGLSRGWADLANVGLSMLSCLSNIASAFMIDRFGRRPLLITTLTIILLVNILISALMIGYEQTQLKVLGICLIGAISVFIMAFAFGPGPICYFLPAELVEQNARSAAQALATLGQMTSRAIILSSFLPLRNVIGEGFSYFSFFVLPIFMALLFLFYRLPETKNRNLREVRREMEHLPRTPVQQMKRSRDKQKLKVGWNNVLVNDNDELDIK